MVITGFAVRYKEVYNCHVQSELYKPLQNSNFKCVRHHPLNTFGLEIATCPLSSSQPTPPLSPNPGESPQPPFSHDSSAQRRLEVTGVRPERLRPATSRSHQQSHTSRNHKQDPKVSARPLYSAQKQTLQGCSRETARVRLQAQWCPSPVPVSAATQFLTKGQGTPWEKKPCRDE